MIPELALKYLTDKQALERHVLNHYMIQAGVEQCHKYKNKDACVKMLIFIGTKEGRLKLDWSK